MKEGRKEDAAFTKMLNRFHIKRKRQPLFDNDRTLLASRTFNCKFDCPRYVLHIFATNKEVNQHNNDVISALCPGIQHVDAENDQKRDEQTGEMRKQAQPLPGHKEALPETLQVSKGAGVVLTMNLDIEDGLVNGTFGRVSRIVYKTDKEGK